MDIIIAIVGGVLSGYVGAVSSSGGFLSLSALIYIGLPVPVAIATNRFSAFGLLAAAIPKYSKAKKVEWRLAYTLVPLALLGGLFGSNLVISIDKDLLDYIFAFSLLLVLPVALFVKKPSGNIGGTSMIKKTTGYLAYFGLMIYGGLIGAGMGMLLVISLFYFFNISYLKAVATNFVAWFAMSVAALVIFVANDLVDYRIGIPMAIGMYFGGKLGASHAIRRGDTFIRLFIVFAVLGTLVKLLL